VWYTVILTSAKLRLFEDNADDLDGIKETRRIYGKFSRSYKTSNKTVAPKPSYY
jgi:hypothetical protein